MTFDAIHVIINPAAGGEQPILQTLNSVFQAHDFTNWAVHITKQEGDASRFAQKACDAGADLIAVYGGDGTQRAVAGAICEQDVPMAILLGGTGNALADELGIPLELEDALALIFDDETQTHALDLMQVGDHDDYCLLHLGSGIVDAVGDVSRDLKDQYGELAYLIGLVRQLQDVETMQYQITLDDDDPITAEGVSCLIVNSRSIGLYGLQLDESIAMDDGLLDVFVLEEKVQDMVGVASSILGWDEIAAHINHYQAKTVRVAIDDSDQPREFYADGETDAVAKTPMQVRIIAGAFRVLLPADSPVISAST